MGLLLLDDLGTVGHIPFFADGLGVFALVVLHVQIGFGGDETGEDARFVEEAGDDGRRVAPLVLCVDVQARLDEQIDAFGAVHHPCKTNIGEGEQKDDER